MFTSVWTTISLRIPHTCICCSKKHTLNLTRICIYDKCTSKSLLLYNVFSLSHLCQFHYDYRVSLHMCGSFPRLYTLLWHCQSCDTTEPDIAGWLARFSVSEPTELTHIHSVSITRIVLVCRSLVEYIIL